MLRVLPFLLMTAATVWAFVECLQTDGVQVRTLPKPAWLVIIFLAWFAGAVGWFVLGRPRAGAQPVAPPADVRGSAERRRPPMGPDDDPEFLARMRDQLRRNPPDPTGPQT